MILLVSLVATFLASPIQPDLHADLVRAFLLCAALAALAIPLMRRAQDAGLNGTWPFALTLATIAATSAEQAVVTIYPNEASAVGSPRTLLWILSQTLLAAYIIAFWPLALWPGQQRSNRFGEPPTAWT